MLFRTDGTPFSVGRSRFVDRPGGHQEQTGKIYVKIEPEAFGDIILAQLDTGSPWLILHAEIAAAMSLLDGEGPLVPLRTITGLFQGRLERTLVTILADEGESIQIEATAFVSPGWTAGTFRGYTGFLERLRFTVDPSDNSFYFGPI